MSIVTLATFQAYIRDEGKGLDGAILQGYIDAASQTLNNACGRQFVVASATPSVRTFAADRGTRVLTIDDATTVTAITESGVTVTSTNYQLEPVGGLSRGEVVPYTSIRRLYQYWYADSNQPLISVTGTWGWAAIPYQITQACLVLGKELCNNQDVRLGIQAVVDGLAVGIRRNPIVGAAIRDYARGENAYVIA